MPSYIGDLLRYRPAEGRALLLRVYRRNGCSAAATALAFGIGRQYFYQLTETLGLKQELAEVRRAYDARFRLPPDDEAL